MNARLLLVDDEAVIRRLDSQASAAFERITMVAAQRL